MAKPEQSLKKESFVSVNVSGAVISALRRCVKIDEQDQVIDDIDIITAMISSQDRASKVISTMYLDSLSQFSVELQTQKLKGTAQTEVGVCNIDDSIQIKITANAAELLILAARRAQKQNRQIVSDDFILSDLDRERSLIRNASAQMNLDEELSDMMIREISRQTYFQEQSEVLPLRYATYMPITPRLASARGLSKSPEQGVQKRKPTENWTELAKTGSFDNAVLRPELIRRVIGLIVESPITVLVSDNPEEAEDLLKGVAREFAKANGNLVFGQLHKIDQISLTATPEAASVRAITSATGGTLFLPDADQYLDQSSASSAPFLTALKKELLRMVTIIPRSEWNKAKNTFPFRGAKEIIVPPMNAKEKGLFLKAHRLRIEADLKKIAPVQIQNEAIDFTIQMCAKYYMSGEVDLLRRASMNVALEAVASESIRSGKTKNDGKVDNDDIVFALFEARGIVVNPDDPEKYLNMEAIIAKTLIGQPEAVAAVARATRRSIVGLNDPNKPRGKFMFLGPTGVGKTELGKALARFLFDDESALITIDMSEYMEKHNVSRLIGAPPGYVGFEEGGQLTEKVKRKPYSVVMFDEIEKAHPDAWNLFLQILDSGQLTDGRGQVVDFRNCYVIYTGNVGTEIYMQADQIDRAQLEKKVIEKAKQTFRPEFLNRLDSLVVFNRLSKEDLSKIADIKIAQLNKRLSTQNQVEIVLTPEVRQFIVDTGYIPEMGARPLDRAINDLIVEPIANQILASSISCGQTLESYLDGSTVKFRKK